MLKTSSCRLSPGLRRWILLLTVLLSLAALPTPLLAQTSCTSTNPCILGLARSYRCGVDEVSYYDNRFLQSHFDNGTPNDFSDDPIIFAITNGMTVFGATANTADLMSLPDTSILQQTLDLAKLHNKPFIFHVQPWGCQHNCAGTRSATVKHLMCGTQTPCDFNNKQNFVEENWMEGPTGDLGFSFSWCSSAYTFTYSLHPDAGLPGADGLQALLDRNLRHIASWIKSNIIDVPANRKYLLGLVIATETHYGGSYSFDYGAPMLAGFQGFVKTAFSCATQPGCLTNINQTYGTSFPTLSAILPPTAPCSAPLTSAYCKAWNDYRNEVLVGFLGRIATIFEQQGVPTNLLFGHDLVNAGGFVKGPVLLPNRNPGLTAYKYAGSVFHNFSGCTTGGPGCREWAVVEGFLDPNSCVNDNNIDCYGNDLEHMFDINMKFIQVMPQSLNNKELLGSNFEKGIHKWGMRYSSDYSQPFASITYNASTRVVSGCVYDADSRWRGTSNGSSIDANNVPLEIRPDGQAPIATTALVSNQAPWCGSSGINFSRTLAAGQECFSVFARDYPADNWVEVFRSTCDQEAPRQYVDAPSHNQIVAGSFLVKGWSTDASGVVSWVFKVDGSPVTLSGLNTAVNRSGVCSVHSDLNDPNCPYVGWQGTLDTTEILDGQHTLSVIATDAVGNVATFNRLFFSENDAEPPRQYVDAPSHNQTISGLFLAKGWAIDESGVVSMSFKVDGSPVTLSGLNTAVNRSGVCSVHSDLNDPDCPYVGWQGTLNTAGLASGSHTFTVTATDAEGRSSDFNRKFLTP